MSNHSGGVLHESAVLRLAWPDEYVCPRIRGIDRARFRGQMQNDSRFAHKCKSCFFLPFFFVAFGMAGEARGFEQQHTVLVKQRLTFGVEGGFGGCVPEKL